MEKVASKVARFIELSSKFSKSLQDVFPNGNAVGTFSGQYINCGGIKDNYHINNGNSNIFMVSGTFILNGREIYVNNEGEIKTRDNKPLTRADEIRAEAEIKAKLSDEFDEYNKLRNDLTEYFSVLKKVTE